MRILFRCDEYPPANCGGIGSVTKIVAEELIKRGHEIFVVGSYQMGHNLPAYSKINGVTIFRLTHFAFIRYVPTFTVNLTIKLLNKLSILSNQAIRANTILEKYIQELIIKEKIDCLEITDYNDLFKFIKKEIKLQRFEIPTILRAHGSISFLNFHKQIQNKIHVSNDINNFKRCSKIIAVSKFSENYVNNKINIRNLPSEVIFNPIEDSFLKETSSPEKTNYILFIGKVSETKGAFSLIKAFNTISRKNPDLKLIFLGGGEIEKAKTLINADVKNKVLFKGYIPRTFIKDYIDNSKFCVIPTYFENFSMVALEIMARSKALIYSKRTSGNEIIQNLMDGILIDPENIDELIVNIQLLLDDNDLRRRIEQQAFLKIKNKFIVSIILNELEFSYKSIINE